MMNVVAICVLVSSLAAAGFWSPAPEKLKHDRSNTNNNGEGQDHRNVIVKDGHRVVVVEYDKDGHHPNTKVSISPEEHDEGVASTTAEMDKTSHHDQFAPKELICDAFGKCKHRIAATLGKAKDKVSEEVDEIQGAAKDALGGTLGKAGDSVSRKAHEAVERTQDAVKEGAKETKDAAGDALGKARESVSRKAHEAVKTTKDAVKSGMDMGKTFEGDVSRNVSEAAEEVREKSEKVEAATRHAKGRFEEFGRKYLWNWALVSVPWSYVMGLLGFATAYGVCMWVTFISSYVLAGALPKHRFGMVQSKIYPVYFRAMATSVGAALLGHSLSNAHADHRLLFSILSSNAKLHPHPHVFQSQVYNLLGSLLMVLINMIYLEPRATKVMFERMKLEKEEGRGREHVVSGEASRRLVDGEVGDGGGGGGRVTGTGTLEKSGEDEVMRSRIAGLNRRLRSLNTYSSLLNILTLMSLTWHLVYLSLRLASTCGADC